MLQFQILPERPQDTPLVEPLLDRCFGPDRLTKTVYRLREGIHPVPELSSVAVEAESEAAAADQSMLASIRFWPVLVETTPAILLGPLAVDPRLQGRGLGRALVRHGLDSARRLGHKLCIVVGEPSYYSPYGFIPASPMGLILPGPVDPPRFQVLEMAPGILDTTRGLIGRDERSAEKPAAGKRCGGAA